MTHKSPLRLIAEPLAIAIVLAFGVRAALRLYVIPSSSMAPTLLPGDHIVVTPYRFGKKPSRGDVIVFRSLRAADELMIKRVIGTPGDLVETRAGRVIVCGHALTEPYVSTQAASGAIAPQIIPADSYFVLGDNRADSLDSRSWGVLPREAVLGRARLVLWSSDAHDGSGAVAAASSTPDTRPPAPMREARLFRLIQ
ncbi:MAG: signal peptidase I [Acidobacteria bacterium]|nr:signal peptidase I [Acidobacteriota bacterium]MBV9188529.1 signal peptidase I [Acidobacteriota bacterium]